MNDFKYWQDMTDTEKDKDANDHGYCCFEYMADIDTYSDWKYCPHCGKLLKDWKRNE
jgi:hypothetical protein